jgi:hypothetical protein
MTRKTKKNGGARSRSRSRSRSPKKSKDKSPTRSLLPSGEPPKPKSPSASTEKSPPKNKFKFKSFIQKSGFDDLPDPNEFEQIYIGIGAKYYKYRDYPLSVNTGAFQLYPNFVDCEKSALIIIIDPQLDVAVETQKYVESSILGERDVFLHNTTYIMINANFNKRMSTNLVSYLEKRPSLDNLWICSFVTFISPNSTESAIEHSIDAFFENATMPYKNNSYKWLGTWQPYILRKYSFQFVVFAMSIQRHRAKQLLSKIKPIDPDKYLNFCYDADFEESTKMLLEK